MNKSIRHFRNEERKNRNGLRVSNGEIKELPNFRNDKDHLVFKDEKELDLKRFYTKYNCPPWSPELDVPDDDAIEPLDA